MDFGFIKLDEVDSTSDYIKRGLKDGTIKDFPTVVSAVKQTAGRGRLINRSFFSPEGGMYFSCAFSAEQIECCPELITIATGAAVIDACTELCRERFDIKWVNDVLYNGKKIGGILCESVGYGETDAPVFIVGIGINLPNEKLDGFMPEKVGTLPASVSPDVLMCEILNRLQVYFSASESDILNAYNSHLSSLNKRVEIVKGDKSVAATVLGASASGLVCKLSDGTVHTVRTCDELITNLYSL